MSSGHVYMSVQRWRKLLANHKRSPCTNQILVVNVSNVFLITKKYLSAGLRGGCDRTKA